MQKASQKVQTRGVHIGKVSGAGFVDIIVELQQGSVSGGNDGLEEGSGPGRLRLPFLRRGGEVEMLDQGLEAAEVED